ncbi:transcription factor bHLH95 [Daucus carota subsp. sativus]|uniref:transcription factor bHLH95 n=1 Tax=Daucus carota subsp. sativus TaxID=79200 RepID=UPI003083CF95
MSTDLGIDLIFENDETWDFLNIEINSSGELGQDGEKHLDSSTPSSEMAPLPPPGKRVSSDKEGTQMQMMKKNEKEGEGKREASEQEKIHIFTERERRKKMRTMFTNLHALLPQLPTKADKSTIVDEAVSYIKSLEHTLKKLEKQKQERLHGGVSETKEAFIANQVSTSANVFAFNPTNTLAIPQFSPSLPSWCSKSLILNVSGLDAQICVCSNKKPGLLTGICLILENYKLEVISAQVSSDKAKNMYMFHTHACCSDLLQTIPVEEIYKQAVREITIYFNLE